MKMADIEKKAAARDKEMQTLAKAQDELAAKIEAEKKAAKEAAAAGDREAFGQHQTEAQALQDELEFSKIRLQTLNAQPAITLEEAKSAWESFRKEHDTWMQTGLNAYQEVKAALMEAYKKLLDKQAEMIRERDKLARLAGIKAAPPQYGMSVTEYARSIFPAVSLPNLHGAETKGTLKINGSTLQDPDAVFYMADHAVKHGMGYAGNDPFVDYMNHVVASQTFSI